MAPTLLALTYATQMEALKRYRTCGEQKVTVQHVSVSAGAQAIVGNVTHYHLSFEIACLVSGLSPRALCVNWVRFVILDAGDAVW